MNLLVPVNFSSATEKLLDYVSSLAKVVDAHVHFVHVINTAPAEAARKKMDHLEKSTAFNLESLKDRVVRQHGIMCEASVLIGKVAESIVKKSTEVGASMIVMASHGITPLKRFLTGSTVLDVAAISTTPVMIVPANQSAFSPLQRIVFASECKISETTDLQIVTALASQFNATVQLVHVVNRFEDDEDDFNVKAHQDFAEQVRQRVPYDRIVCEEYQHTDVTEGIRSYAEEERADIITIPAQHKTFLERLCTSNLASQFVLHLTIPVLLCPSRTNSCDTMAMEREKSVSA